MLRAACPDPTTEVSADAEFRARGLAPTKENRLTWRGGLELGTAEYSSKADSISMENKLIPSSVARREMGI